MNTPNSNLRSVKFIIYIFFLILIVSKANSTTVNITVQDFVFTPDSITVIVGDTVQWTWIGARAHTTTCDGVFPGTSLPAGAAPWDVVLNSTSPVFKYKVTVEGEYDYVCTFHGMLGKFIAETTLPVELTDFVATTIKNEVILDWATVGEINNDRFEIQRIDLNNKSEMNPDDYPFVTIGVIRGNGNANYINGYSFADKNLKTGIYLYRLKQIDYNSNYIYHLLNQEISIGVPSKFNISQNYPNPFNPVTKINFELPTDGQVNISVFDISGKLVATVINENMNAGYQTVDFNASNLSSGVYIYRINLTGNNGFNSLSKKMTIIK